MVAFTDKSLKALTLEPGRKDRLVFDDVCPGLGVRVTAAGRKLFLAQWVDPTIKRKVREPIGTWGAITIEQARTAARALLGDVARGINPKAEKEKAKAIAEQERRDTALTLDALISEWATLHLANRRPVYRAEAQRAIRHAFSEILKRPASRLSRADAVKVLDAIASDGKTAMAGRVLACARACYSWGLKRGKVPENPFAGLPISTTTESRDRVLTDDEIAEIWAATEGMGYPFGPFFRTALLTLQRRDEVAGMRWGEVSDDMTTWRIPAARMKNGKAHDVHLAETARVILRSIPRVEGQELVFSTTGKTQISGFSKAKLTLDMAITKARAASAAKIGKKPSPLQPWRLHDFRRSGVSMLARLGFDSIVVDKLLAHQPAKLQGVAAVYQRYSFSSERTKALEVWAAHVTAGNTVDSRLVNMRGRRQ
jgi:integrase